MKMSTRRKLPKSALRETLLEAWLEWSGRRQFSTRVRVTQGRHATGRISESLSDASDSVVRSWFVIVLRSDQHLLIRAVLLSSDVWGARCIDITRTREFRRISYR